MIHSVRHKFPHRFVLLLLAFISAITVHAQEKTAVLQGTVQTTEGKPVPAATISLYRLPDSALQTATVSNDQGRFTLAATPGNYLVSVTHILYATHRQNAALGSNPNNLQIQLETKMASSGTATVSAQKPVFQVKSDRIIFNVAQSITGAGMNAFELLSQSPGVMIDGSDQVLLNGLPNVTLQTDGKNMVVTGRDLVSLLKALPAAAIESIEIMANPSMAQEAAGTGGIINIKLKKNQAEGLNGSINTSYAIGFTPKFAGTLALNFRKGKVNIFGNYSHNLGYFEMFYNFYRLQSDSIYDSQTQDIDKRNNGSFKAGIDLYLNKRSTLGLMVNGLLLYGPGFTGTTTTIAPKNTGTPYRVLYGENDYYQQYRYRYMWNLNYRYEGPGGSSWSADADYGWFNGAMRSLQPNIYSTPAGALITKNEYRSLSDTRINISGVKLDREQPLGKGRLSAGLRYSKVETDNGFRFLNLTPGGEQADYRKTNDFGYNEAVYAAYAGFAQTFNKTEIQLGLRMEHTRSAGTLFYKLLPTFKDTTQQVKRQYTDFFPNVSVLFNLPKSQTLTLAYARRIDRPLYADLNPFVFLIDELSYFQGNPFLNPQYNNRFSLAYSRKKLFTTLAYSFVNDYSARITDSTEGNKTLLVPRNIGNRNTLSLNVGYGFSPVKWWQQNWNANLVYLRNKGAYDAARPFAEDAFFANGSLQNTFKLPKNYTIELNGSYNFPALTVALTRISGFGTVNVGFQKTGLFKNQGSLRLSVSDIFHTSGRTTNFAIGGISMRGVYGYETRQLRCTFSLRFGNSKIKQARQKNNGVETETRRTDS